MVLFNRPNLDQLGETWLASFTAVATTVQGNGHQSRGNFEWVMSREQRLLWICSHPINKVLCHGSHALPLAELSWSFLT